jgi:uncharacterized membrane protein YfcA
MELELSIGLLLMLFLSGALAGFVDAIAGGGGLIALPMLLFAGLSPAQALATNKLQGSFGTCASSFYFIRKGLVNLKTFVLQVALTFLGAALGTLLVQQIDPGFLTAVIPILLILIALYFLFSPNVGEEDAHQRISTGLFAVTVGFGVGFYDGFFGPGAGSFFAIGFVCLLGYGLTKATAHTKVLNFTSNIASLIFFVWGGQVVWSLGLTMAAGQLMGAYLGARLVVLKGSRLIKPLVVVICVVISVKLLVFS